MRRRAENARLDAYMREVHSSKTKKALTGAGAVVAVRR